MATLLQLQAEPWWGNETIPPTLADLRTRLLNRWRLSADAIGIKGNPAHLTGRHRSLEWVLNSAYCTNRSYGTVDARDRRGNARHLRAMDISMPGSLLYAACKRLDQAVRAGRLPEVAEWFGTFDGHTVVGWYEGHASTSDDSHLWHLHIGWWTESADNDHSNLYKILTGEIPAEEEDTMLHGQVPTGQTPIIVCTPWAKSGLSLGCDLGSGRARLRVAEHEVNVGWHVSIVDISATDNARKDLPMRTNVDRRSIMRLPLDANDKMTTPVGYIAWWT